jgi:lipoprotein-anchoring transpeptidase ErfK/SrfK
VLACAVLIAGLWYAHQRGWLRTGWRTAISYVDRFPETASNVVHQSSRTNVPAPPVRHIPITNAPPIRVGQPLATNAPILPATNVLRPVTVTNTPQRAAPSRSANVVFEAQLGLDRRGFSPGPLDGVMGSQTRAAVRAWQQREGLPVTGELDSETLARLTGGPALTMYRVTEEDRARLMPVPSTWLGKSEQARLDYETLLELVAEKFHSHPDFIRRLNPGVDWHAVWPGTELSVPTVERERPMRRAAYILIRLGQRTLQVFDGDERLMAHFPCSIAARVEKRPVGELYVTVTAPRPNYTFDPEVFPESAEGRQLGRKLVLPPGPNNPVGTVWIGLSKPGYGIHGTPKPEEVGRTESHGCFRLANWNAEYLLQVVSVGTPVRVEP